MADGHGGARPGAGHPNELGETRLISLDMPVSMIEMLDTEAQKREISRAKLIRDIINQLLRPATTE